MDKNDERRIAELETRIAELEGEYEVNDPAPTRNARDFADNFLEGFREGGQELPDIIEIRILLNAITIDLLATRITALENI